MEKKAKKPILNLVGQKFGKLEVIKFYQRKNRITLWMCKCECGTLKPVAASDMKAGKIVSCGCVRSIQFKQMVTKHGDHGSKEYGAWKAMKARCREKQYVNHNGKGIKVCKRWLNSYDNFLSDMGRSPSEDLSVDRINNLKGYSPSNCRWATQVEQCNNKSNNILVQFRDKRQTLSYWAKELNIKYHTLYGRIYTYGWTISKAFGL
jgi:hypothetical protein